MAKQLYRKTAYGLSDPILNVPDGAIVAKRDPTTLDRAQIGTEWVNTVTNTGFILTSIEDNASNWEIITNAADVIQFDTDSGTAIPAAGIVNILGSDGISTFGSGDTVTIDGAAFATTYDGDSGSAAPAAGVITFAGGTGITTSAAGSTVTISSSVVDITYEGDIGSTTEVGGFLSFSGQTAPAGQTVEFRITNPGEIDLYMSSSGSLHNTIIGGGGNVGAGLNNAIENTGVGYLNLSNIHNSTNNCAFGSNSLAGIDTGGLIPGAGSFNSGFGYGSLSSLVNGDNNSTLGSSAGSNYTTNESSNICINNPGTISESHVLRIGSGTGTGTQQLNAAFISGIQGVNVGSVASVVSISGDHLGSTTITAGSGISVTPGANTITIAATGAGSINTINGNSGSVTGTTVTLTTGAGNANGTTLFTGVGTTMTMTYGDGHDNLGIGTNAALFATANAASSNIAIGADTLSAATISGGNNVAIGVSAGSSLTSGAANVFIGSNAGELVTSGNDNVAISQSTLDSLTTGSRNIVIGQNSGTNYTSSESDNIIFGFSNGGTIAESNVLRVGSGTGTSSGKLNSAFISGIQGITVTGTPVLISATDQLGIAVSSKRFKNDIQDMQSASEALYKLRPVTFTWNRSSAPGLANAPTDRQYGLIAEEVANVIPQIVNFEKNGKPLSVNYGDLASLLVNEIQKLQARVAILESK